MIHENPQKAHYFMEGEINTTVFEDKMSVDIIASHLPELRELYLQSQESKGLQTQTFRFLPVHEVIHRLGLDGQMAQVLNQPSTPYRMKGTPPGRDLSNTPSKELLGSDHNGDYAANLRSDGEDSEEELKRIVFEFRDRYYVNEDQEMQKEVEKFNKASTSPYDHCHSDCSDEYALSASGITQRNQKFLFGSPSSHGERSQSFGAVEESLQEDETPRSLVCSFFRKYWFTDLFEENVLRDGQDKYGSLALNEFYASLQPRTERTSKSTAGKLNIRKLQREDYYYKLDDEISREMHEKKKAAKLSSDYQAQDSKKEDEEDDKKSVPPLLMNFIDQKALEMQDNDKQSNYTFGFPAKPDANPDVSKDKKRDAKEDSKPKATPKKKKKKGNQIIIDDNEEEASLFRSKPKKGKAKKNEIRQQQQAKTQVVKEEVFPDDEVSEIPQTGLEESLDNEKDEVIEDLLKKKTDKKGDFTNPSDITTQANMETVVGETTPVRSETAATFPTSDAANAEAADGKDKKKKKKKVKKPTVASKPGSQAKDAVNEELSQPDKEKDLAITEVDGMLRKNDNLLLLIFDVLDNNFISEEFYVDKRRHFSKYVYVSDLGSKIGK